MLRSLGRYRDYYAGGLLTVVGAATALQSVRYGLGSMVAIGPGAFPFATGCILGACGLLIAGNAKASSGRDPEELASLDRPEWRGWICIAVGFTSFIGLAWSAGLVAASFACVFISACGDRTMTLKAAGTLAVTITIFCVLLFHYGLHINLPLFAWEP